MVALQAVINSQRPTAALKAQSLRRTRPLIVATGAPSQLAQVDWPRWKSCLCSIREGN